jgi:hypothetical protein
MMALTAASTKRRLARFAARSIVGRHNVRQLVQTGLLALARTHSVVNADPYRPLTSICPTGSSTAHDGYRIRVSRERGRKPRHLLNGVDVCRALPEVNRLMIA